MFRKESGATTKWLPWRWGNQNMDSLLWGGDSVWFQSPKKGFVYVQPQGESASPQPKLYFLTSIALCWVPWTQSRKKNAAGRGHWRLCPSSSIIQEPSFVPCCATLEENLQSKTANIILCSAECEITRDLMFCTVETAQWLSFV